MLDLRMYYLENEGWERVWCKYYRSIMKYSLEDRELFKKKLMKRFGPNNKRILMESFMYKDPFISKLRDLLGDNDVIQK